MDMSGTSGWGGPVRGRLWLAAVLALLLGAGRSSAGETPVPVGASPPPAGTAATVAVPAGFRIGAEADMARFFTERVEPVFVQHCHECHGASRKFGGLRMHTLEGLLKGGHDFGPGVVPWKPEKSSVVLSMRWDSEDEDMRMPPKKKLPDAVIADITRWVAMGAPWPEAGGPAVSAVATSASARPPFLGRVHPALVHLPIAVLLLAALFELLALTRDAAWRSAVRTSLVVAVVGGALSIASGLLLAGDQDPILLRRHEQAGWASVILAALALAADAVAGSRPVARWLACMFLVAAVVAVAVAGHGGGAMVYGSWF